MRARDLLPGACLAFALGAAIPRPADAAPPPGSAQAEVSIDGLLRTFARMPGLHAKFREHKHIALLAEPLVNEGTLHYFEGKLARHTHSPLRSSLVVRADRLEFGDESGQEQIDLGANPVVKLFVDSFVKILAGDRAALEEIYAMELTVLDPASGRWRLVLRPKLDPMDKVIDRMELEGRRVAIDRMLVVEKGGDETATSFSEVDVERRYTRAEVERIFRVAR